MSVQLILAAAGPGSRLGFDEPKALIPVAGVPLIARTLGCFAAAGLVNNAILVVPPGREGAFSDVIHEAFPDARPRIVAGGAERQISVGIGVAALEKGTSLVVIHDAARPFVSAETIREAIEAATATGAATVAVRCMDTILLADADRKLEQTPDRSRLWTCQTPQVFAAEVLRAAHARARSNGVSYTDDATLVREYGAPVKIVEGPSTNFKITTRSDLGYAEYLVKENLI